MHGEIVRRDGEHSSPEPAAIHTSADLAVSESTMNRIRESLSPHTRRAYARHRDRFETWCAEHGRVALPATAHTLTEYVGKLCDDGLAPATISQAISAIRTFHAMAGFEGQPDTRPVKMTMRQYRRERAEAGMRGQRESPPVTIDALRAMVGACDLTARSGIRDRILIVLGLALMGRRSELVALTVDDVTETSEGIEIAIRTSKTDKDSRGEVVAIPQGTHPLTNPVAALRDWVAVLTEIGGPSGRLLRSVDMHGNVGGALSPDAVNRIVRRLALEAGIPRAAHYTAHSLRAGGATVAYAAGVPVSTIAKHGRWNPNSPVVLRYIRAVDRWKDNAMRNVGL